MKGQKKNAKHRQSISTNIKMPNIRHDKQNNNHGITLVALVVSIIVMLVLAGVSINAVVGDNGIITQAQSATYATSRAVLEEWLNQLYVEHYDELEGYDSKVEGLSQLSSCKYYFYDPLRDSNIGTLHYVVTTDGYAVYLINKSQLPDDIKSQIAGGDAGDGEYNDYVSLNDVYGVTTDLKVYYCSAGTSTILGITTDELESDNPLRTVEITDSALATVLSSYANDDGTFNAQTLRGITELTVTTSNVNFAELYNLSNLQKLYLENVKLTSLSGIENCPKLYYVYNKGSSIGNYNAVGELGDKLEYLYFYNITDSELETACSKTTGIGNYDLPNLTYFAVVGTTSNLCYENFWEGGSEWMYVSTKSSNTVNSIQYLDNLTDTTKKAIKYMSLQNNNITTLSYLSEFTSLILLRAEYNALTNLTGIGDITSLKWLCVASNDLTSLTTFVSGSNLYSFCVNNNTNLTTLSGLSNCSGLYNLYAMDCNLGSGIETTTKNTTIDALVDIATKTSLYFVDLRNNSNLIWIDYLSSCTAIKVLKLDGCTGIDSTSMYAIKSIIDSCTTATYDSSYSIALLSSTTKILDLTGQELTYNEFTGIGNQTQLTHLSLKNVTVQDSGGTVITDENTLNALFENVLTKLTNMQYLQLYGVSKLSSIAYVENMNSLIELDIRNTSITNLTLLETMTTNSLLAMKTLAVNVTGTNLFSISNCISGLTRGTSSCYWYSLNDESASTWSSLNGGLITNSTVLATLNGSNISKLHLGNTISETVSLSNCMNLKSFYGIGKSNSYITLPNCIENVTIISYLVNFSEGTHLTSFIMENASSMYTTSVFDNVETIDSVEIKNPAKVFSIITLLKEKQVSSFTMAQAQSEDLTGFILPDSVTTLSIGSNVTSNSKIQLSNFPTSITNKTQNNSLTSLIIRGAQISSVDFLNDFNALVSVDLAYNALNNFGNVTNQLSTISSLNLTSNCLTSLKGIENFTSLQTLTLTGNTALSDTAGYTDSDGSTVTYNNLALLASMNTANGGSLAYLYMEGCTGIIDFTPVSSLSWSGKSGF